MLLNKYQIKMHSKRVGALLLGIIVADLMDDHTEKRNRQKVRQNYSRTLKTLFTLTLRGSLDDFTPTLLKGSTFGSRA